MPKVGDSEPWEQEVWLELVDSTGTRLEQLTLEGGRVQISILDSGVRKYWDGSAFVSAVTTLTTTLQNSGKVSFYDFTIPAAAAGKVLLFEGWGIRRGKETKRDRREVKVDADSAELSFDP